MRARFNLAVALAFDFDVYIVPKQFAWKSKATSERLLRLQAALKDRLAGKSILMTNTDFDFIAEFCDQGLVLDQGAIVYSGSFADCRPGTTPISTKHPRRTSRQNSMRKTQPTPLARKTTSRMMTSGKPRGVRSNPGGPGQACPLAARCAH